jgi:chromosome segregation protein
MTKINKLVMQGFKSFAKRTELNLGDKFNCVLGPNGSGKSNIMDAVCFVLGKGSAKGLRAEKSVNLIYNGGKSKQPAKQGEVSIYFDNSKKTFPLDEKEVVISRIVKKTGQSVYKINHKTRTRQQVLDLLSLAKIDPDGYNIILQGDIVKFVEMPTSKRREIIEEISGIGVYEEKKNKAIKELDKVEEKLNEAQIVLSEKQSYLKDLKKDRNQAMKYKEMSDKIKENKASMLNIKITARKEELEKVEKNLKEKEDQVKKYEEDIKKLKQDLEERKEIINEINKEVEEKGDKDQVAIQKDIQKLNIDIGTNKNRIGHCQNEIVKIEQRKNQLERSLVEVKEKTRKITDEKDDLESKLKRDEEELKKIEKSIEEFKKDHNLDKSSNLEMDVQKIDQEAESLQEEIQKLREEQQNLIREKDKLEYQVEGIDEKIEKVSVVEKENKKDLEKLKQKKEEFKKTTVDLSSRLNEDSSLAAQISNAREKLEKANEELAKSKAKNVSIKEKIAGGMAIQKITEQKNKIRGIYGTVSELGVVKSEYGVALEAAAGSRIRSIVVENDKVAAECIKYLKSNRLGMATFLPLNKMKPVLKNPELQRMAKSNGVIGFAIDLIDYDSKFAKAFSYVFGNTLVVENIDVARRLGIGSARMVTLEGDLAETSGAMHGGFRAKSKGLSFQEKGLNEEIEKLEKEVSDLRSVLSKVEAQRKDNEEEITRLRTLKANLEGEIIKSEKSLHLDSEDLEVSRKLKSKLRENIEELDKDIEKNQSEINKNNVKLADLKTQKQKMREKISMMRNPSVLAELNTFEEKRDQLKEEINESKANMKNVDMQIENLLGPEQQKSLEILKQHDKEMEDFNEEIKDLKEKIKIQESELKEKEAKQEKFRSKFKSLFAKRDKLNQEISKIEKNIESKQEKSRELEKKVNVTSLDKARINAELSGLNEEFKQYEGVKLFKNKSEEQIKKEIWQFEKMVNDIGAVNMRALEVYEQAEKEYDNLIKKKEKLGSEREDIMVMMNEIESKKKELFMKTFEVINQNFKKIFSMLSSKGQTFLEIEDPKDLFNNGVLIKVRVSGKKFLDIRSLSGGEKTMTALAFIFAIQEHEPASFYILDEVDAALDKRNSEKLGKLLMEYSKRAQYLLISHNDGIISEAENLYGVSMNEHGISKVVSLKI